VALPGTLKTVFFLLILANGHKFNGRWADKRKGNVIGSGVKYKIRQDVLSFGLKTPFRLNPQT